MDIQSIKNRFGIIGNAPALSNAIGIAERVSSTNLTVLISGESGVGKEVFSHIIHQLSPRKHNNFIAVNCGAIPEGTIDSELFGHEKGSFTGANEARKGYFETVNGGTIFLDEIGELPIGTQARLLRVLESGEYIRVGSSKVMKTDVRVVAATNVDLKRAVANGRFREDLFYRLNTVPISIPSLRERGEDVLLLFRKFSVEFAEKIKITPVKLTDDAKAYIVKYSWPGNVRQLKNVAEQVSILSVKSEVTAEDLVKIVPDITQSRVPALNNDIDFENNSSFTEREILYKLIFDVKKDLNDLKNFVFDMVKGQSINVDHLNNLKQGADLKPTLVQETFIPTPTIIPVVNESKPVFFDTHQNFDHHETVDESLSIADKEKELIEKALKKHRNKRKDAAADLGISERTLYRKIKEYNLE